MRVLLTQTAEDTAASVAALESRGHRVTAIPLVTAERAPPPKINLAGAQGFLVVSTEGARALAEHIGVRTFPVFADSDVTADALRRLGFKHIETAKDDASDLARLVEQKLKPANGALIYACSTAAAVNLPTMLSNMGFAVRPLPLYSIKRVSPAPKALRDALEDQAVDTALFLTPDEARAFVAAVQQEKLEAQAGKLTAVAATPVVAAPLRALKLKGVSVPDAPDLNALFDALSQKLVDKVEEERAARDRRAKDVADAEAAREREAAAKAEQERVAQEAREKAERARQEQERLAREQAARDDAERLAREKAEKERIAAEKAAAAEAERARKAAEKAEKERIAREKAAAARAEKERLAAERAEQQRIAREQEATARAEKERLAAEKAAAEKAERERLAAERAEQERLERERLAAERAEKERRAAEKAAAEKAERERLAAERAEQERLERERLAAERAEKERRAAEKAAAEKAERERVTAERAEQERQERVREAAARAERERIAREQIALAESEQQRLELEKAELLRQAQEKAAAERAEEERIARERAAAEKAERERLAAEKAEQERQERERLAAERTEQERIARKKAAAEKAERERVAAERAEQERQERERLAAERAEQERIAREKAAAERAEQERLAAEHAERKRIEQERAAAEKAERKRIARETAAREKSEKQKAKEEEAARKRAEKDRVATARAAEKAERAAQPRDKSAKPWTAWFTRAARDDSRATPAAWDMPVDHAPAENKPAAPRIDVAQTSSSVTMAPAIAAPPPVPETKAPEPPPLVQSDRPQTKEVKDVSEHAPPNETKTEKPETPAGDNKPAPRAASQQSGGRAARLLAEDAADERAKDQRFKYLGHIDAPASEADAERSNAAYAAQQNSGGIGRVIVLFVVLAVVAAAIVSTASWWVPRVTQLVQSTPETPSAAAPAGNTMPTMQEDITALKARVGVLEQEAVNTVTPDALKAATKELTDRLAALEAKTGAAQDGGEAVTSLGDSLSSQAKQLAAVSARLATLEAAIGNSARLEDLSKRLNMLEARTAEAHSVLALSDRVTALETTGRRTLVEESSNIALLMAVGQWREALLTGRPFALELQTAKTLATRAGGITIDDSAFAADAAKGLPTLAELQRQFGSAAAAAMRASAVPDGVSAWYRRIFDRVLSIVTIRRLDGDAAGTGTAAILARAETRLNAGDLAAAVIEMDGLSSAAASAAQNWQMQAKARVAAERAASDAITKTVAILAAEKTPPAPATPNPSTPSNGQ